MKNWTIIQIFIYLVLFGLGIYFFMTTKWVGPEKYYVRGTNLLGWIAVIAFVTYFVDRVIMKNRLCVG